MNKLIKLSPTGIEYGNYSWNFASGCGNNINGKCKAGGFRCWAYSISQRFECYYPNGFKPTIYPEAFLSPLYLKKPSRILCAFMGDLFWNCPEFSPDALTEITSPLRHDKELTLREVLWDVIDGSPQHTFLFLTKQPQNLIKWSPFSDNCWVGVSITTLDLAREAITAFAQIEARIKFALYEPCYNHAPCKYILNFIDWLIIGSQTKPFRPPSINKVEEIVRACDEASIKVFIKNNLYPLLGLGDGKSICHNNETGTLRQEVPK